MPFRRHHKSLAEMLHLYSYSSKYLNKNKGINAQKKLQKPLPHFNNSLVLNYNKLISIQKSLVSYE